MSARESAACLGSSLDIGLPSKKAEHGPSIAYQAARFTIDEGDALRCPTVWWTVHCETIAQGVTVRVISHRYHTLQAANVSVRPAADGRGRRLSCPKPVILLAIQPQCASLPGMDHYAEGCDREFSDPQCGKPMRPLLCTGGADAVTAVPPSVLEITKMLGPLSLVSTAIRASDSATVRAQSFEAVFLAVPSYEMSIPKYFLPSRAQFFVASLTCGRRLPNPPPTG